MSNLYITICLYRIVSKVFIFLVIVRHLLYFESFSGVILFTVGIYMR